MARDTISQRVTQAIFDMVGKQFVVGVRATVDPGSVAAEASGQTDVTATGARIGDLVSYGVETIDLLNVNAAITVYVADADTVTINVTNNNAAGGAAIDLASASWQFVVERRNRTA